MATLPALGYGEIALSDGIHGARLFLNPNTTRPPKWLATLKGAARNPEDLGRITNRTASFALLIEIGTAWYAACGGLGSHHIKEFFKPEFGLDVLTRLVSPGKIKAKRQKVLLSEVKQVMEVYRGKYDFSLDPTNWGRLTRELIATGPPEELSRVLGIPLRGRRAVTLEGKDGFQVHRAMTVTEAIRAAESFEAILAEQPRISIMRGCKPVEKKQRTQALFRHLTTVLQGEFESFKTDPTGWIEHDIGLSYSDVMELLRCEQFTIRIGRRSGEPCDSMELVDLFFELHRRGIPNLIDSHLTGIRVSGVDEEGGQRIDAKLGNLLHGEIRFAGKLYFVSDGRWYELQNEFLDEVDGQFRAEVDRSRSELDGFNMPAWSPPTGRAVSEDRFIDAVCEQTGFYKFHTHHVIVDGPDRAELCDILDVRRASAKLVFIKRGLGAKLRELCEQAYSSALLYWFSPKFKAKANDLLEGRVPRPHPENIARPMIVLAFVDLRRRGADRPLAERLTSVAKLAVVRTVRELRSALGHGAIGIYEIDR